MVGSVLALIATGIGLRFPVVRDRATKLTARFALLSCASVSLIGLLLATTSATVHGNGGAGLAAVGAFVIAPLLLVSRAAHRCLRLA